MTTRPAMGRRLPIPSLPRLPEVNPVLVKELRSQFRGVRAFVMVTAFLVVLAGAAATVVRVSEVMSGSRGATPSSSASLGTGIFQTVALVEFLLVVIIAPALTQGSVSGEKERQTWDLLLATPLSGARIVLGKVGAAMAFLLLLVLAALPVMSLAFLYGGVSAAQVVLAQATVLVAGLEFLLIALVWSTVIPRTVIAAVATYPTILGLAILPFFAQVVSVGISGIITNPLLNLSPYFILGEIVSGQYGSGAVPGLLFHVLFAGWLFVIAAERVRRSGGPVTRIASRVVLGLPVSLVVVFLLLAEQPEQIAPCACSAVMLVAAAGLVAIGDGIARRPHGKGHRDVD
jgi:ABC-2 type transport system permease protein